MTSYGLFFPIHWSSTKNLCNIRSCFFLRECIAATLEQKPAQYHVTTWKLSRFYAIIFTLQHETTRQNFVKVLLFLCNTVHKITWRLHILTWSFSTPCCKCVELLRYFVKVPLFYVIFSCYNMTLSCYFVIVSHFYMIMFTLTCETVTKCETITI